MQAINITSFHRKLPQLGDGIYLTADVAQILKLPYSKVRHLMNNFWHGATFGEIGNRAINFFALIEFYTYYHLRDDGFTPGQIKKFHTNLSKELKTDYPFASIKVKTPIDKNSKSKIWFEFMGSLYKGDGSNKSYIPSFIEPFIKQIEYGKDLIAKRFYPIQDTKNVVVDPLHQFGQPVINGTNLQTKTINYLFVAGETKRNICILYDITEAQVNDAIRYYAPTAA